MTNSYLHNSFPRQHLLGQKSDLKVFKYLNSYSLREQNIVKYLSSENTNDFIFGHKITKEFLLKLAKNWKLYFQNIKFKDLLLLYYYTFTKMRCFAQWKQWSFKSKTHNMMFMFMRCSSLKRNYKKFKKTTSLTWMLFNFFSYFLLDSFVR